MESANNISNLFSRVTALEQEEADNDQAVARIIKLYATLGIKVTITARIHQYRLAGDSNPLYPATCATDSYI